MRSKINIILLLFIFSTVCYGIYSGIDTARTEGMCSAGVSDVSSVEAVVKNPALAYTENVEFLVDYKKFFLNTKKIDVEGFIPADIDNITLAGCFPLDERISAGVLFNTLQTVQNFYSQKMLSVVVNFKLVEFEEKFLLVGFQPEIFYLTFDNNEKLKKFLFNIASTAGTEKVKFSLVYQAATEVEDRSFTIGGSYLIKDNFTLNTDVIINSVSINPLLGVEVWYKNIAVRSGVGLTRLSFGVGIEFKNFLFDVSTVFPYKFYEPTPSLHVSTIFRF